ncbi:hypothetical protein PYCCODRAFT_544170 [Trametes coccinea BRFM310]|uniref:Uncharacterized protein n=1 Tax=Trametes coccinea (strain BRFM310) TaxID=1353009 RepID=A0A1Y2IJM0_TRAC3|nr:hypothetical protein PYCCODRAFT_544170 [Trametes coccinea BRFM310]
MTQYHSSRYAPCRDFISPATQCQRRDSAWRSSCHDRSCRVLSSHWESRTLIYFSGQAVLILLSESLVHSWPSHVLLFCRWASTVYQ